MKTKTSLIYSVRKKTKEEKKSTHKKCMFVTRQYFPLAKYNGKTSRDYREHKNNNMNLYLHLHEE
jgi:hypothetical protein